MGGSVRNRRLLSVAAVVVAVAAIEAVGARSGPAVNAVGQASAAASLRTAAPIRSAAQVAAPIVVVAGGPASVPTTVTAQFPPCGTAVDRRSGEDRYATAVDLAPTDASGPVYLASGDVFADGIAVGPLAAATDGIVLLTRVSELPDVTRAELERRQPDEIVIVGGPASVSEAVEEAAADYAPTVRRVHGPDRYATAAEVALAIEPSGLVFVASGENFPDALAVGPVAGLDGGAVLLTRPDDLPDVTADALSRLEPRLVAVVGGTASVSTAVADAIAEVNGRAPDRIAGPDRYATAVRVADYYFSERAEAVFLATGRSYPDALTATPLAVSFGAPLVLVGADLQWDTVGEMTEHVDLYRCRAVRVVADPVEALTLGPSSLGHSTLTATVGEIAAVIEPGDDESVVLLPDGAHTTTLTYPKSVNTSVPAVTWTQQIAATQTELVARQPWRGERPSPPAGINLAWQYLGTSAEYRGQVYAAPGLNITAPFRYSLRSDGSMVGGADPAFIADMHARGIEVWPTIHTCGATCIHAALSDPGRRADLARRISDDARDAGADGVNIDIEGFYDADGPAVTSFVQQLADRVRAWGGVTSYDFTVMTDTWATPPPGFEYWSTAPDRRAISAAVDYAVLMAYDEFNRHRPAGPVASRAWVDEALRYQLRYSDPGAILLGVPLYGRIWSGTTPATATMSDMESFAANGTHTFDPRFGMDRLTLADGRYTWEETPPTLAYRVDLVERFGLAGTASWRLGFDNPRVWQALAR